MTIRNIFLITGLSSVFLLAGCSQPKSVTDTQDVSAKNTPQIVFDKTEYDFGIVKQSEGKVEHEFTFTYKGNKPLKITGVPTSCGCTSAVVDKTDLKDGDTGILTVRFNPNLHAEPDGKFFKTIALITDPPIEPAPEVKIWAEIDLDLGSDAFELKEDHDEDAEDHEGGQAYHSITPAELSSVLSKDDVVFVDVHIPEQEHIAGTDMFIPYNEIEDNLDKLPADKDTPIVLYCRSGGMSRVAAYLLVEKGYTNIYDLVGGKNAYDAWSVDKTVE